MKAPPSFNGTFSQDTLTAVLAHLPLDNLFHARAVCTEWKRATKVAPTSSWWRALVCQHACGCVPSSPISTQEDIDWEAAARQLAASPFPSLRRRLLQPQAEAEAEVGPPAFEAEEIYSLLGTLNLLGELAVVDVPEAPLASFLGADVKSLTSLAIYMACSQKPADPMCAGRGLQRCVYSWWRREAPRLAARVRERLAGAPAGAHGRAQERLAAFVKFMVGVALPYVDRSYVRTFCSSTLRVLSVKEIGEHAVASLTCEGAAAPPPLEDDVSFDAQGEVDEAALLALTTSRLLEAEMVSLQQFANMAGAPWAAMDMDN